MEQCEHHLRDMPDPRVNADSSYSSDVLNCAITIAAIPEAMQEVDRYWERFWTAVEDLDDARARVWWSRSTRAWTKLEQEYRHYSRFCDYLPEHERLVEADDIRAFRDSVREWLQTCRESMAEHGFDCD